MENLDLALWLALYPFASEIASYLGNKQKIMRGEEPFSKDITIFVNWVHLFIYILMTIKLW